MTRQYFPSNSSEGFIFEALYCEKCYKEFYCSILKNAMAGKQPKQWIYDENDEPTCTSFVSEKPKKKQLKPISDLFMSADVKVQEGLNGKTN